VESDKQHFFNLALAVGQSLALIRSQEIQRRGRGPVFIKVSCQVFRVDAVSLTGANILDPCHVWQYLP